MGVNPALIRQYVKNGRLTRVCRGYYVRATDEWQWPEDRHRVLVKAQARSVAEKTVFSHESAASVHGLPLFGANLSTFRTTIPSDSRGSKSSSSRVTHFAPLGQDDVVIIDGIPVTSVARTVADLARTRHRDLVVCLADSALNRKLCTLEEIDVALRNPPSRYGLPRARHSRLYFRSASESVAESWSRLIMSDAAIPTPELQRRISCPSGQVYRVDFLWEEHGVIGECDGMDKYFGDTARHEARQRLRLEKDRENTLQAMGFTVVRWTWSDLSTPQLFVNRVRSALEARGPRRS